METYCGYKISSRAGLYWVAGTGAWEGLGPTKTLGELHSIIDAHLDHRAEQVEACRMPTDQELREILAAV